MSSRPAPGDAPASALHYIERITVEDPLEAMSEQLAEATALFAGISEEQSLARYAPGKWSIREVLGHITDTERIFAHRALWFARSLPSPLPGFDQDVAAAAQQAQALSWVSLVGEFRSVRHATVDLFRRLPAAAWERRGIANDHPVTVRALAFMIPGHAGHHLRLLRDRYL
jgi:hypothetical protein